MHHNKASELEHRGKLALGWLRKACHVRIPLANLHLPITRMLSYKAWVFIDDKGERLERGRLDGHATQVRLKGVRKGLEGALGRRA